MNRRRGAGAALLAGMVAAVLLLAAPAGARANDSAMGGAGMAVKPIGSTTIRMAAETVQVVVFSQFAEYQVDFQFENTGSPQRVKLGFPFPVPIETDYTPPAAFRAWQGTTALPVTYREVTEGGQTYGYYLHEADFPTGKTMIRVRYYAVPDRTLDTPPKGAVPPARFAGAWNFSGAYPYTVSTGAGWAGTIGTSVIRYYVSPDALMWGVDEAAKQTAGYFTENGMPAAAKLQLSYTKPALATYQWRFTDFEPTPDADGSSGYDIELPFYYPQPRGFKAPAWAPYATVRASSQLKLGKYDYPAEQAVDGDPSDAWAEDAAGPGTGQSLVVTFPSARQVREIRVLPGYAKTEVLFRKYNRPRTLSVVFSDGTRTELTLTDDPDLQRFPVDVNAKWARVTIGDVYRGTTRNETYLSEIEFAEAKSPAVMPFEDLIAAAETASPASTSTAGKAGGGASGAFPAGAGFVGALRFPARWRAFGWPLFALSVGCCGVLLGLLMATTFVLLARKRSESPSGPSGPPAP